MKAVKSKKKSLPIPLKKKKTTTPEKTKKIIPKTDRGLVMVITGNGKGKTTAAFGQALRSIGQGYNVFIVQFMKGRKYGEFIAAQKYLPNLTIRRCGLDSFVMRDNPAAIDIQMAQKGLAAARKAIKSGKYDMVILDEANVAIDFKLISLHDVIDLIKNKPAHLDLILTGRYAPTEIIDLADTVSDIQEIKHHYAAGIKDRAGIEF
ncbi:MAG TPA: cob(I)yrinic acid a,c-diamide adenosyltransferase [Deltaproteobacteria bacterium]|nr:cob(I)yrinic acid a,c-diamide adenosyltransferase [Deltaproteobacteria bacterium]